MPGLLLALAALEGGDELVACLAVRFDDLVNGGLDLLHVLRIAARELVVLVAVPGGRKVLGKKV